MKARSFGFYSAIHILIITAVLGFGVAAQDGEWNARETPPDVLEENKRTGDVTYFEDRADGSTRVTRTTHFPGTNDPSRQRVVTTSKGVTTIASVNWNEQGEAIAYTEEVMLGAISYAESKNDINWQGKQIQGSRWYFRQRPDGSIDGEKIEEYLSPNTRKWTKIAEKVTTAVHIFHHPARQADARKAQSTLTKAGYEIVLHPLAVAKINTEGQWVISRSIYYYPADGKPDARTVSRLLRPVAALDDFKEADGANLVDKKRSITVYLLDESVIKKPAAPAPAAAAAGNNGKEDIARPEGFNYAPYDSPGRDQIAAALERNYAATKQQVDRPDYDDNEATRLLKETESIFAFAEEQMLKEVPRSPRWQRFKEVKDQADRDIRALKERLNKSKPETTLAGKWRLLINDQQQPGEFTFEKSGPTTVLKMDSKLCLLVFGANLPTRTVAIPAEAQVRLDFGRQVIQLRGDAASNRLEFWATPDLLTPEFQKTKYALVREEKSR